ncbi:MAG: heme ABC exporter ATP-binding protein CcmA [Thermodesulfobacteriota bacterium]
MPTTAPEAPFLCAEGVRKTYGGVEALRGVSFALARGEFLCLFGPNGAGKSTLLKILSTLLPLSAGTVRVQGFDLEEHAEAYRARLGVVSHQSYLYDDLTALENLEFYAGLYAVAHPRETAERLLEQAGLYERRHSPVAEFSRGMVQRLSIARALVNDPSLLLLDEPYTGLDEHAANRLRGQLERLHDQERTIVMVTHNLRRGLEAATRLGILARGRLTYMERKEAVTSEAFEALYFQHLEAA